MDLVQIQQVLVNFLHNPFEAMATSRPREARIATRRGRLFVPSATTKKLGMGLGLSICKSIIEGHGGLIGAESNSEGSATFYFTLPLIPSETATRAPK